MLINDIEAALINEAHKNRAGARKKIFNREQSEAIKQLRNNNEIVIRKSDKSNNYVIIDKCRYKSQLDEILCDNSKF